MSSALFTLRACNRRACVNLRPDTRTFAGKCLFRTLRAGYHPGRGMLRAHRQPVAVLGDSLAGALAETKGIHSRDRDGCAATPGGGRGLRLHVRTSARQSAAMAARRAANSTRNALRAFV